MKTVNVIAKLKNVQVISHIFCICTRNTATTSYFTNKRYDIFEVTKLIYYVVIH